ncbi:MAG: GtrA family protein [Propionibacteriaceae bacterium]|nr:GtrA family protein [Propionibacteriaceae bacterium]
MTSQNRHRAETSSGGSPVVHLLWSQPARYVYAGGASFVFNLALLNLFREFWGWPTGMAAVTAFWGTFVFSFLTQRVFAFRATTAVHRSLLRYCILVAVNSVVVAGAVTVAHEHFRLGLGTSQLIATILTTVWNYFAYRHWVYVAEELRR